jgi:YbbR domain-containing protein
MATATHALVRNWRLKVSALAMAVFLWAVVQTEPRTEETFSSVPVRVEISDTMWTISGAPVPATVDLRLGGPAREIIRLAREGATLRVPIATVGSQDTVVSLRRDWVELGQRSGLIVESVSPSAIRISFERAVTRRVPVSMRMRGSVRDGLALARDVAVNPRLVRVRGPESRVRGLDSIALQPFDLGRVTDSDIFTVAVDTSGLAGASVVPQTVTLDVRVEEVVQRLLGGFVVHTDVTPGQAELVADPMTIELTLSGARTVVTALDPSLLRISVPEGVLEGMAPGEERVVGVLVEGVPELVTAILGTERVTVRRTMDLPGGGGAEPERR